MAALQPAGLGGGVQPGEAPVGGARVQPLPRPLEHDENAARPQCAGRPQEHVAQIADVVQRPARHDRVDRLGRLVLLEIRALVAGRLGRGAVDPDRLVAGVQQPWHEAAERPAADLQDVRGRRRELGAHERPERRLPALAGVMGEALGNPSTDGRSEACAHELGRALADHDRRSVRVARGDQRHHGRVGDAQALDPVHPELRIDDGQLVDAHLAGAGLMVVGDRGPRT